MVMEIVANQQGRWLEPQIADYGSFFQEHPEAAVSSDLLTSLRDEVARRARTIDNNWDPERQRELQAEINLRIIEAATSYRSLDPVTNAPVFDYLQQHRGYIVHHAAGKVSSQFRRERREAARTLRLLSIGSQESDEEDLGNEERLEDVVDARSLTSEPTAQMEHDELRDAISARLSPAQLKVFHLLDAGLTRPEIGQTLGLSRQTVHDHVVAIRKETSSALARRLDEEQVAISA